jgi:hypothetical protein
MNLKLVENWIFGQLAEQSTSVSKFKGLKKAGEGIGRIFKPSFKKM